MLEDVWFAVPLTTVVRTFPLATDMNQAL